MTVLLEYLPITNVKTEDWPKYSLNNVAKLTANDLKYGINKAYHVLDNITHITKYSNHKTEKTWY